jgi:biotin/methionine sulfoxide reductase
MTDQNDLKVTPFSTHWGTYYAEVQGGRLTGVRDYADDPDPAEIGPGIVDMVDHPTRISQPMIRKSYLARGRKADPTGRGREPFVAVPWDEALDIAGAELQRVAQTHGNEAIFGGSYGWGSAGRFHHAQSQVHRFLNCIGGYVASTNSYSHAAVDVISPHVVGRLGSLLLDRATSWNSIVENTRLVVMFGGLPVKNAQVTSGGVGRHTMPGALRDAKSRGVEFVSISPIRSDVMPEIGAEWLTPRPNTDMAVMLGLAHTLVTEGLHDRNFLARYTVGFERLLPYLTGKNDGQPKDADWAARISGLDAENDDHGGLVDPARRPWRAAELDGDRAGRHAGSDRASGGRLRHRLRLGERYRQPGAAVPLSGLAAGSEPGGHENSCGADIGCAAASGRAL